jgi:hypothetical protein
MARFTRTPTPSRVVWWQDDVTEPRFYWLAVRDSQRKAGTHVTATLSGQKLDVTAPGIDQLLIRWNDQMADLDQPITIQSGGRTVFEGHVIRTIETMARTLGERGDPKSVYCGEVEVHVNQGE